MLVLVLVVVVVVEVVVEVVEVVVLMVPMFRANARLMLGRIYEAKTRFS